MDSGSRSKVTRRRPRGRRPFGVGVATGLALLLGLGSVLQELPDLIPGGDGLIAAALAVLGGGVAATAQAMLERTPSTPGPAEEPALRRRLPPPVEYFTGHSDLMDELRQAFDRFRPAGARRLLRRPRRPHRGPLAVVITGESGTGKSQLVAQIVDEVSNRFPDGKLEFELYGGTDPEGPTTPRPARRGLLSRGWPRRRSGDEVPHDIETGAPVRRGPRRPEDVLAQMLTEIGVRFPEDADLDELSGLWRTETEERRLLIVLDNAEDHAQVEPLLPLGRGCAVLITSRNGFPDAPHTMLRRRLDPLSPDEGLELLIRLVDGSTRPLSEADRAALPDLAAACHGFPMAICLSATQIIQERGPSAADQLRHMKDPVLWQTLPGPKAIASSLASSLRRCEPRERLLLNRLAGAGLTTFTAWSAAALLGVSEDEAKPLLLEMSHRHLVTYLYESGGFDRFQLHDHVRDTLLLTGPHVLGVPDGELADWSREELERAVERLLLAFDRVAAEAARRAAPHEWSFGGALPGHDAPGDDPWEPRQSGLPASTDPMAWLDSEYRGFEACFQWTRPGGGPGSRASQARRRRHARAVGYGWRLRRAFAVLCRTGHTRWEAMREATWEAAALALEMGDPFAYGVSQLDRAEVASGHGDHDAGHERALTALYVLEQLAGVDPRWPARARRSVGVNLYRSGDLDDGRAEIEEAVKVFAEHDDRWWQVRALCNLAEVDRFQGHLERAYDFLVLAQELLVGSQDVPEQWARVQLQKGEVLRLRGFALNAWFVLEDERERIAHLPHGDWYHARYLRSLGRLSTNELNREAGACELLLSPDRGRERRRLTARDPRWPSRQRARVTELFVDGDEAYAERFAEPPPPSGLFRRRPRVRDAWQASEQISRLLAAERAFAQLGDAWGRWRTCLVLGETRMAQDRGVGKEEMLRAAAGFHELGDKWWHARAHRQAAEALQQAGRLTEAEELARVAVEGYGGLRHRSGQLRAMKLLAATLTDRDLLEAWRTLREAADLAEEGVHLGVVPDSLLQEIRNQLSVTENGLNYPQGTNPAPGRERSEGRRGHASGGEGPAGPDSSRNRERGREHGPRKSIG
ncbi:tetratricopeptide repeat protein [Nocardiopsis sp. EMB25]|uniref:tetratricopeptide repeat protein n=1 Tax=Nocardiopsis sp. EMB25 TaxID=2835867 RepID=UPI0022840284|nr:tetratricopeptide repeat protein [Nocardiopsis sp. EMB25]MCY9782519.1 tetratricopeptide repeat protein [Nocardiopsis sp. EMB25]